MNREGSTFFNSHSGLFKADTVLAKQVAEKRNLDQSTNKFSMSAAMVDIFKMSSSPIHKNHSPSNLCFRVACPYFPNKLVRSPGSSNQELPHKAGSQSSKENQNFQNCYMTSFTLAGNEHMQKSIKLDNDTARITRIKQLTLDKLASKLRRHKYLFIRSPKQKIIQPKIKELPPNLDFFNTIRFDNLLVSELRSMCCQSREQSMLFQHYIESCPEEIFSILQDKIFSDIDFLMLHEYGCYVVQRVMQRSYTNIGRVEKFCREHFIKLAFNEFSSRVLQILIKNSSEFRQFVFESLKGKLNMCADSISVVFLLAVAIESSLDPSEYDYIKTTVFTKTKSIIQSKFLKRLVVVLIENLPEQGLDQLFVKLKIDDNFMEFF